jgi:hypothetical protein
MKRSLLLLALAGCAAPDARPAAGPTLDILLWFDTEDYLLPASDDAALWIADFLSQEGIRATFKVVGEKARTLEKRGRQDVIAALRKHEIGYHSNLHSVHPTPAQYMSALGWDEGVAEFLRREARGAKDVERILGKPPVCYGQPGSSWGPQAFGALREMGIPMYLDDGTHVEIDRKPIWYGGILTCFRLEHSLRTGLKGEADLEAAKKKFDEAREKTLREGGGVAHVYYHPCEWVHQEFWDGVNFRDGANPPREAWKAPPQKTAEETKVALDTFKAYVRWMKTRPGVRFLTARDALGLYQDQARGFPFTHADLRKIAAAVGSDVTWSSHGGLTLTAAETLHLLLEGLAGEIAAMLPAETPFGPSEPGPAMPEAVTTDGSQFTRAAMDVRDYMKAHGRVPSAVWLGSRAVTPEAFYLALAKVVASGERPSTIELRPAALGASKHVADDSPKIFGWLFPKGWSAPRMMELAKRQAWTIKPAVRG